MASVKNQPGQIPELPRPVAKYLRNLERQAKQKVGVVPEAILEDAREFLQRDFECLQESEPGIKETEVYDHFVDVFGSPEQVADSYESADARPSKIPGYAPGWRICCTKCGRSAPAAKAGITARCCQIVP